PENIGEEDLNNIIIHEQAHIKRFDHITKILAYLILSVHWFNPFNWLLFKLFSEDTEFLCDEKTLATIGYDTKNSYINTFLKFSTKKKRTVVFYNVGFSFHTTKRRIKNMLNMKKTSKTMTVATVCMCLFILCSTVTNAVVDDIGTTLPPLPVPEKESAYESKPQIKETTMSDVYETVLNEIAADNTSMYIPEVPYDENVVPEISEPIAHPLDTEKIFSVITEETSVKIKSNEVSDLSYIGIEQIEFPAGTNIPNIILNELKKKGITESGSGAANLTQNYLKDNYNTKDNYYEKINGVLCDENGNISFYMELNSGNFMDVTITDSETGKQVIGFGMLAGGKSAYTLLGFDKNKSYNIEIKSVTDDEWNLEGQYIIY
ncbi:MAG: M56 family metallopeptidase, partial [Clostridia bacterium]|nr:M56 family metallopeptidase [Clostridia bacterium]